MRKVRFSANLEVRQSVNQKDPKCYNAMHGMIIGMELWRVVRTAALLWE